MSKKIFEKEYSWEGLADVERDVYEAIAWNDEIPNGEFQGIVKITIEYSPLKWGLYRQDDNGNVYLVDTFEHSVPAENEMNRLETRGHKQTYWVEEVYE